MRVGQYVDQLDHGLLGAEGMAHLPPEAGDVGPVLLGLVATRGPARHDVSCLCEVPRLEWAEGAQVLVLHGPDGVARVGAMAVRREGRQHALRAAV